ncbi:MAG: DNA topoisomerase (ATP-hydrolyzing), partial [Clostridia bacterium]
MAKEKIIVDNSKIYDTIIEKVLHTSMMTYSEHVILDRALPRVEDGLKPVHRRILYTMMELGLTPDKPHKKSARIVGDCLGKYHPHGDSSVYGAMVRLAQPYNIRMTLVDGHGNFGSIDGDSAAAMRYTEARLTPLAMEMLRDLDKETVPMSLNFDDSLEEPDILPSRFPNLLVNGASGIAVGLATNIPTHNLEEVIDGVVAYIDNPDIELDEMMKYIPAPDFPTGGFIINNEEIRNAFATGKGRVTMRAKTSVEKDGDKQNIIINELPYQVNKPDLLKSIYDLKESKKELFGNIIDVVDESDRNGMRAVIKLKKDTDIEFILAGLYKSTNLQMNFGVNMVAIANGKPQLLGLVEIIKYYVEFQREIIYKRSQYDLTASKRREHILKGLMVAVKNIREVVEIVLNAKTYTESKENLSARFDLSEKQAIAVLDIPLKRLNKLDIGKMEEELKELERKIADLESILSSKKKQLAVVRKEILEIKKKYPCPRMSQLISEEKADMSHIDLNVKLKKTGYMVLTQKGALKYLTERGYQQASKGIVNCSPNELAKQVINCSSDNNIIGFTEKGNCVIFNIDDLDEDKWKGKGVDISKLSKIESDDNIVAIFSAENFVGKEIYIYTRGGMVKRSECAEYNVDKKTIYPSVVLKDGDKVLGVEIVNADMENILFVSDSGMALNAKADIPVQG